MIEYWEGRHGLELFLSQNEQAIIFNPEEKARLLNVLKRGANTLSPPDLEIVRLIGEMEK